MPNVSGVMFVVYQCGDFWIKKAPSIELLRQIALKINDLVPGEYVNIVFYWLIRSLIWILHDLEPFPIVNIVFYWLIISLFDLILGTALKMDLRVEKKLYFCLVLLIYLSIWPIDLQIKKESFQNSDNQLLAYEWWWI